MLIMFNILFWLSGCAVLGIGIWMRVDPSIGNTLELLSVDSEDPMLEYASYVLIAMGAFVFLVGFLGCCGAIKENKCMLGLYIFFLLIIMAGELAAGIMVLLYKDEILDGATDVLREELHNNTIYTSEAGDEDVSFTSFGLAMTVTEFELKCCGVNNYTDYAGSAFQMKYGAAFPASCCTMEDGAEITFEDGMNIDGFVKDINKCYAMEEGFFHAEGCRDGIEQVFSENAIILIGVAIGVACLEIFGFIFAVCLCRNTGDDDE